VCKIAKGDEERAMHIFQETFIVLMRQVQKPEWELRFQLNTFFCTIAKRILWRENERADKSPESKFEKTHLENLEAAEAALLAACEGDEEISEIQIRQKAFEQLGEGCRELLAQKNQYIIDNTEKPTWKEIARRLQSTEGFLKKKASECREKLQQIFNRLK
jgi:RNA polymerase sigma factor (sigma-70 family)